MTPFHRPSLRRRRREQIEVHLGTAVIKAPEDVQAKHLTKVLRALKAAL